MVRFYPSFHRSRSKSEAAQAPSIEAPPHGKAAATPSCVDELIERVLSQAHESILAMRARSCALDTYSTLSTLTRHSRHFIDTLRRLRCL